MHFCNFQVAYLISILCIPMLHPVRCAQATSDIVIQCSVQANVIVGVWLSLLRMLVHSCDRASYSDTNAQSSQVYTHFADLTKNVTVPIQCSVRFLLVAIEILLLMHARDLSSQVCTCKQYFTVAWLHTSILLPFLVTYHHAPSMPVIYYYFLTQCSVTCLL